MVAIKALSVLALASAAIAAPVAEPKSVGTALVARDAEAQGPWQGARANYSWRYGWGRPQGQSSEESSPPQPQPTEPSQTEQPSQPQQPAQPESGSPSSPASSPAPSSGGSTGGSGSGYMAVVSEWRSKMGLPALSEDSTLQSNAQNAADSSGGQLKHKLNPGSMAQVMAPGDSSNFESVFVGGWLCEMPSLPGLDGVCSSMSKGWDYAGQTGHAEILSSTKYTKIGCGLGLGIWSCDLA